VTCTKWAPSGVRGSIEAAWTE